MNALLKLSRSSTFFYGLLAAVAHQVAAKNGIQIPPELLGLAVAGYGVKEAGAHAAGALRGMPDVPTEARERMQP